MKRLTNIVLLAVAILLGSCTNESLSSQPPLEGSDVQIKLALPGAETLLSRASVNGTPQEDAIHSVQLVIYDGDTYSKEYNFSVNQPIFNQDVVWDVYSQTITMRNQLALGHSYHVYAVVNTTIAEVSKMTRTQFKEFVLPNAQPIAAPDDTQGLVMTGMQEGFIFTNLGTVMTLELTRLAAKVHFNVNVQLNTGYEGVTFNKNEMSIRVLNVPNQSFLYPSSSSAIPSTATLMDLNSSTMLNGVQEYYLPENPLLGTSVQTQQNATKFILKAPYSYTGTDGSAEKVDDNYYLIQVNGATAADPYKIVRNTFYNVTVKVTSLGSDIPAITGTEITTVVKPWEGTAFDIPTDNINIVGLSNSTCDIYGDQSDNILVGTASVNREGVTGIAYISTVGEGFSLISPQTVTLTEGTPTEIRIKTTADFTNGKVFVKMVKEIKEITINKKKEEPPLGLVQDTALVATSDATWCTLSTKRSTESADQQQFIIQGVAGTVYINPTKHSFDEKSRIANIMFTTEKTVKRVVVVQKPGVTSADGKIQWATGNICLGKRPDGKECYVIGGARELGLWFLFNRNAGFEYSTNREAAVTYIYVPSGTGSLASVGRVSKSTTPMDVYNSGDYVGDPCASVYNENPAIKWRTPTNIELEELAVTSQYPTPVWVGVTASTNQHLCTLNGALNIQITGRRKEWNQETIGTHIYNETSVNLWSSVETPASIVNGRSYYFYATNWYPVGGMSYVEGHSAMAIRCVRDIKKN